MGLFICIYTINSLFICLFCDSFVFLRCLPLWERVARNPVGAFCVDRLSVHFEVKRASVPIFFGHGFERSERQVLFFYGTGSFCSERINCVFVKKRLACFRDVFLICRTAPRWPPYIRIFYRKCGFYDVFWSKYFLYVFFSYGY